VRPMTTLPEPATTPVRSTSVATDLALIASFAAFIAACSLLPAIPVGALPVPITLQTFAVALTGAVLGARRGFLATLLYVVVGLAGAPIFAGATGGLATVAKPSFGYLIAFPLAALVTGWLSEKVFRSRRWSRGSRAWLGIFGAMTTGSLLVIHPLGIAVLSWRLGLTPLEAATAGLVFIPGDLVKNALAAAVATAVHRAYPDLISGRR
jgi:biotin transport system substrate-specific component